MQNFAVYGVEGDELIVSMYKIEGELLEGEERTVEMADQFGIVKDAE